MLFFSISKIIVSRKHQSDCDKWHTLHGNCLWQLGDTDWILNTQDGTTHIYHQPIEWMWFFPYISYDNKFACIATLRDTELVLVITLSVSIRIEWQKSHQHTRASMESNIRRDKCALDIGENVALNATTTEISWEEFCVWFIRITVFIFIHSTKIKWKFVPNHNNPF